MNVLKNNVLACGFNFPHHSNSSGYHHLVPHISNKFLNANSYLFGNSKFGSLMRKINLLIFDLLIPLQYKNYNIIHFIYPENHIMFSVPKNKISVATVHLPVDWLEKNHPRKFAANIRYNAFSKLDGIITLSQEQSNTLKEYFPNIMVKFIPHGINQLVSQPVMMSDKQNLKIVIIGSNFRDYKSVTDLLNFIQRESKSWELHMLGLDKKYHEEFGRYQNVKIYKYLDETEYMNVIANSHVNYLPVTFATANNALLESHALGVPTIATDLDAIRDYSLSTTRHFNSNKELINHIINIDNMSIDEYNLIREKTFKEAKKFYWENIKVEVNSFYDEISNIKGYK